MARESAPSSGMPAVRSIEELTKKYKELEASRIRADETLRNAQEQLKAVKERARKEFGTDNLDELRARLEEMKAENERRRAEFQQNIEQVSASLLEVEENYRDAKSGEAKN